MAVRQEEFDFDQMEKSAVFSVSEPFFSSAKSETPSESNSSRYLPVLSLCDDTVQSVCHETDGDEEELEQVAEQPQAGVNRQYDALKSFATHLDLANREDLLRRLDDERQGIIRDDNGEAVEHQEQPIFGEATRKVLDKVVECIHMDALDRAQQLIEAKADWPAGGPLLPAGGNGNMVPERFFSDIEHGKANLLTRLKFDELPTATEWMEIENLAKWSLKAKDVLRKVDEERLKEIVVRTIERDKFPKSWLKEMDKPEKVLAAWNLIQTARDTSRLLQSLDYVNTKVSGSAETRNAHAELTKNLPSGVTVVRQGNREDGKIERVKFNMPEEIAPQSPKWLMFSKGLHDWSKDVRPLVEEQMKAAVDARDPRNVLTWMDLEMPGHYVRQETKGIDQILTSEEEHLLRFQKPELAKEFNRFNLLKFRFDTKENFDEKTGNLTSVDIIQSTKYCNEHLFSFWKLNTQEAEGTQAVERRTTCAPDAWKIVSDAPGTNKFVKARDLSLVHDEIVANHCVGKLTSVALDASMVIGGGVAIRQGVRLSKMSATVDGATQSLAAAARLGKFEEGLVSLVGKPFSSMTAMKEEASRHTRMGVNHVILGTLGVVDSSSNPLLKGVSDLRHLYFTGSLLKTTLVAPIHSGYTSLAGVSQSSYNQAAILSTAESGKAVRQLAQGMFLLGQGGLAHELVRAMSEKHDPLARFDIAREKEAVSLPADKRAESMGDLLSQFAGTLDLPSSQVQSILADTRKAILEPDHPEHGRKKQIERLANLLLPPAEKISELEQRRCQSLSPFSQDLRVKPAYERSDVDRLFVSGLSGGDNMKLLAAAALLAVADISQPDDSIYRTETNLPAFRIVKPVPGGLKPPVEIDVKERSLTQEIKASTLIDALVSNMLLEGGVSRRVDQGKLLVHLGMPLEVYGGMLKDIVRAPLDNEEHLRALAQLALTANQLQSVEALRESNLSRAQIREIKALSAGLSARDLNDFLRSFSRDGKNGLDMRLFARSLAFDLENARDPRALENLQNMVDKPESFDAGTFLDRLCSRVAEPAGSPVDCRSKLASAELLQELLSGKEMDVRSIVQERLAAKGLSRMDLLDTYCDCANVSRKIHSLQGGDSATLAARHETIELAVRAGKLLGQPFQFDGRNQAAVSILDRSSDPKRQQAALNARSGLLGLLQELSRNKVESIEKEAIIELMPDLLKPIQTKGNQSLAVGQLQKQYSDLMQALVLDDTKKVEALNPSAADLVQTFYKGLWEETNSPDGEGLRKAVIHALVALGDRSAVKPLVDKLSLQTETGDVKVVAADALNKLSANDPQTKRLVEAVLSKEKDPAVFLKLNTVLFAEDSRGSHPDELKVKLDAGRSVSEIEMQLPSVEDIRKQLTDHPKEFGWLDYAKLREEVRAAKDGATSWHTLVPAFPGRSRGNLSDIEMTAQQAVIDSFQHKLSELSRTAFEDDGKSGVRARQVLYFLIAGQGLHALSTSRELQSQLDAGRSHANILVDSKFSSRIADYAAKELANLITAADGSQLSHVRTKQIEAILHNALKHPEVSTASKISIMTGVDAIAARDVAGGHAVNKNSPVLLEQVKNVLAKRLPEDREEARNETELRDALVLKMLNHVGKYGRQTADTATLMAIVETNHENVSVPVKQKAIDLLESRERVVERFDTTKAALPASEEQCNILLDRAIAISSASGATGIDEAVHALATASKGKLVLNNEIEEKLLPLYSGKLPERIRLAAAVFTIRQDSSRPAREAALDAVADVLVNSCRSPKGQFVLRQDTVSSAYRQDAELILNGLVRRDDITYMEKSLRKHNGIIMDGLVDKLSGKRLGELCQSLELEAGKSCKREILKTALAQNHPGIKEALVNAAIAEGNQAISLQLLPCLSSLSSLNARNDHSAEARINSRAALAIALGEPVSIESQNMISFELKDRFSVSAQLTRLHGRTTQFGSMINLLENSAVANQDNWTLSRELRGGALEMRLHALGSEHPSTIAATNQFADVLNERRSTGVGDLRLANIEVERHEKGLLDWQSKLKNSPEKSAEIKNEIEFAQEALSDAKTRRTESIAQFQYELDLAERLENRLGRLSLDSKSLLRRASIVEGRRLLGSRAALTDPRLVGLYQQVLSNPESSEDDIAHAYRGLADLYLRNGKLAASQLQLERLARFTELSDGKQSAATRRDAVRVAFHQAKDKGEKALVLMEAGYKRAYGADSPQFVEALNMLKTRLEKEKRFEAVKVLADKLSTRKN